LKGCQIEFGRFYTVWQTVQNRPLRNLYYTGNFYYKIYINLIIILFERLSNRIWPILHCLTNSAKSATKKFVLQVIFIIEIYINLYNSYKWINKDNKLIKIVNRLEDYPTTSAFNSPKTLTRIKLFLTLFKVYLYIKLFTNLRT
jgi:hypothetical protein